MGTQYPFYVKHLSNPGVTWKKRWTELPPKNFISTALPFWVWRWPEMMLRPARLGEKQALSSWPGDWELREQPLSEWCFTHVFSPVPQGPCFWTLRLVLYLWEVLESKSYYLNHTEHLAWERTCYKMPNSSGPIRNWISLIKFQVPSTPTSSNQRTEISAQKI